MSTALNTLLSNIQLLHKSSTKASRHSISPGKKGEWKQIANATEALLPELEKIYWNGVERELRDIILTFKTWQQPPFKTIVLEDEKDDEIYGFDTFIDQVNESSRELAVMYARQKAAKLKQTQYGEYVPHDHLLQNIARKFIADSQSRFLKEEIKRGLKESAREEDLWERRARMLLQSAGWLDIDKLIEHRPPIDDVGFWKRPMPPQLKLKRFHNDNTPEFVPQECTICTAIIRGSMFQCQTCSHQNSYICETCQNEGHHKDHRLTKLYKHCILTSAIDPPTSRKMCSCTDIPRIDSSGNPRPLFPTSRTDTHRVSSTGAVQCSLLNLGSQIAEAKYDAIRLKMNKRTLDQEKQEAEARKREKEAKRAKDKSYEVFSTETINEKEAEADIPFFVRRITDRYPFGNVHMALRLGPVVVENGVEHTQGGALVTSREPLCWQKAGSSSEKGRAYSLAISEDRELYWQDRLDRHPKRYKTALKQVVGGAFTGLFSPDLEKEIVELVIEASKADLENASDPLHVQEALWKEVLTPILEKLRSLMQTRVRYMLQSLTTNLLSPSIPLKWNRISNNCQDFCSNMLNYTLYSGLLPSLYLGNNEPLYLFSFICRPKSYTRERKIQSKFDVPSGLCEEYLLRFRYGLHVESDIVDCLQEYWWDWGGFEGGGLYQYQDLFPWDCTEAYGRSETRCGDCDLGKHVWSFPFDAWSITSLHLTRSRLAYPDVETKQDWMKNRLRVLVALDSLCRVARVMAGSTGFQKATGWLTGHRDERMDRLKLGGIHRAQPFSHQWEEGRYHEYFVAGWVGKRREEQVEEYERLREERRLLPDVPVYKGGDSRDDDDGGFDGGWGADPMLDVMYLGAYYEDGWDGEYSANETMTAAEVAQIGETDYSAGDDGGGDYGGDGGGCGGGCGGD